MIKAVIFDFDGTLSNRYKNAYDLFDVKFKQYFPDLNEIEYEALLQDYLTYDCNGTINVKFRFEPFIAKYTRMSHDDFEEFKTFYYDEMGKYSQLREDVIPVLEKLKKEYKLAVLSNGDPKSQRTKINNCNLDQYFDEILVSGEIGINKPDRRIFDYMANKLDVKNEECVFVGDVFSSDILGAINADMVPVWLVNNKDVIANHYHGYRINDFKQILDILEECKKN